MILKCAVYWEKPERASNPGQFDGASYYRSKGIAYIMRPDGYTIVGKGNSYPALLDKIKKFWCGRYQSLFKRGRCRRCPRSSDRG